MENIMRQYIIEDFDAYQKCVSVFDEDMFTNAVLKSFKDSKTHKHYVILVVSNMDEYYTPEEQSSFSKYGYYQQPVENRYDNRFFIPPVSIDIAVSILKNESMAVDCVENGSTIAFVVTLDGIGKSHFSVDFDAQWKPFNSNDQ